MSGSQSFQLFREGFYGKGSPFFRLFNFDNFTHMTM